MGKKEFLAVLRESLEGYVPKEEVEKNIKFYRNYFEESDLSEGELLEELGDPRLIARTIIEAYKASKGPMADYYTEQARSEYSKEHSGAYEEERREEKKEAFVSRLIFMLIALAVVILALILLPVVVKALFLLILAALLFGLFRFLHDYFEG
ncbi:MAG: DUF1700 domain-containing protein [Lachnospiraceae bacterium]|nr:DUF1700 domain-containing protein [Lachnospiraceae bacterium]